MAELRVLLVEDAATDAELIARELKRGGIAALTRRVDTEAGFLMQIEEFAPDIVLSDFTLPHFNGLTALDIVRARLPDLPFIFISGTIGEDRAIDSLKRGATDYVLKTNLERLVPALQRAVQEAGHSATRRRMEEALRASNERFEIVAQTTNDALWDWNLRANNFWCNEGFRSLFAVDQVRSESGRDLWLSMVHADDRDRVVAGMHAAIRARKQRWSDEYRVRRGDGGEAYVLDRAFIQYDDAGKALRVIGAMQDLTRRRQMEETLLLRDRAIEASVNPIVIANCVRPDLPIVYVNRAFERVTGYSREETLGRNCRFLQGDDRDQPELDEIRAALNERRDGRALLRNYRKDGSLFWNELYVTPVHDPISGQVTHFVGVQYDITDRKHYQDQLEHQATHDALTGLANRTLLTDRLRQAIIHAQRSGHRVTVAFIDLDRFKLINDSLGHTVGDELLKVMAQRLLACIRDGDTVARLGGDEFVVLLSDLVSDDHTYGVVQRILESISLPLVVEGRELDTTCSVGLAVYPQDGADGETLLKHADAAMYRAKEQGRNNFRFFAHEMNVNVNERLELESGLRRALERGELSLCYEPQIDLTSGRVMGVEALLRWLHRDRGWIPPSKFIPVAEDTGLIIPIGEWVMRSAAAQCKACLEAGLPALTVWVNLSARQFQQKDLARTISAAVESAGLAPQYFGLELTERMVMHNAEEVIAVLRGLKDMGVKLAVDDFGTGYSNLSYLKRFPVDRLKIDQSFVDQIDSDRHDSAIARAVITLAHGLDLKVIAEGVENERQEAFLRANGCDEAQGYLYSRPVHAADLRPLLEARAQLP